MSTIGAIVESRGAWALKAETYLYECGKEVITNENEQVYAVQVPGWKGETKALGARIAATVAVPLLAIADFYVRVIAAVGNLAVAGGNKAYNLIKEAHAADGYTVANAKEHLFKAITTLFFGLCAIPVHGLGIYRETFVAKFLDYNAWSNQNEDVAEGIKAKQAEWNKKLLEATASKEKSDADKAVLAKAAK